jgi:hypothetical protein
MSQEVVDAINDLTRVTIALHGQFTTRAEAVRRLNDLAIPSGRIAAILAMPVGDVASVIAKAKKRKGNNDE